MFTSLPSSMQQLAAAVRSMDAVTVQSPPEMIELGRRLRLIYRQARANGYVGLSRSELRRLPFAYWVERQPGLHEVEPALVRRYWEELLPSVLKEGPRRARRWLAPLLFTYCESFDSTDAAFNAFAQRVSAAVEAAEGPFADKLRSMQRQHSFFVPPKAVASLAMWLFRDSDKSLDDCMTELLLWPGFPGTAMGVATLETALDVAGDWTRAMDAVSRLLEWNERMPARVVKTGLRVKFANGLLEPWQRAPSDDAVKNVLVKFFTAEYGNPQLRGHREYQWSGVSEQAISVLMRWLTGDTLRGFMEILQRTADSICSSRSRFPFLPCAI